jgi:NAD(P)-dependent dehydrogenase (short-subunit alcohol dehydrogenase family)
VPPLTWCMNRMGAPPQRGSIVNISSILGCVGNATNGSVRPRHHRPFGVSIRYWLTWTLYATAKAGVLGLSRTDAAGYGRDGIRINSICPGVIMTPRMSILTKALY